jgi:hypothetical protein
VGRDRKEVVFLTWWHRYLFDPWHPALLAARWLVPVAAVAGVAWLVAHARASRARTWAVAHARWVEIHPPAQARPEDAQRFWLALARVLRRRRRGWAPHVVFELAWSGPRLRLGVWVPGLVAAGQAKRIAETSWPGCSAELRPGAPPVLPDGTVAAGGELAACGGRDWLPLRTDHVADPLRELFGYGLYLGTDELAMVQVAARLASPARQARARAGAQGRRTGTPGAGGLLAEAARALVLGVLNLITEVMRTGTSVPRQHTGYGPYGPAAWQHDPFAQAQQRAAARKLTAGPLWEVAVRYTAATAAPGPRAGQRAGAQRDALGAAFGAFTAELDLSDRPLRDPARVLASRPLRRGFLATTAELAALAHVPYEPGTVAGLRRSGARPVPPPAGVRHVPGGAR